MEPSPFVANLSSIVVISLALISFYLMARKKGKLPPPTIDVQYNTEYSMDYISMKKGSGKIIIVDDAPSSCLPP